MRPIDSGNQERTQRVSSRGARLLSRHKRLVEEKIWNEIQTCWLQQPSCVTEETAWKLVEGLELNSLKSQPICGEHGHDIEDAQELEILYSMPLQWTEPHLAYTSSKRHYKYWSIRWFDLIPG